MKIKNGIISRATGTVLIDEVDLHLHPEWQFTLRNGLIEIFPDLQFIATTHSPHMLASAKPGEVIAMPDRPGASLTLSPTEANFSGWTTDQILSEVMGVGSLDNKDYEKLIKRAFDSIEKEDIRELDAVISSLSDIAHPGDPIVNVLNFRRASLNLLSDD